MVVQEGQRCTWRCTWVWQSAKILVEANVAHFVFASRILSIAIVGNDVS